MLMEILTRTRLRDMVQAVTEQAEEDRTPTLPRATESAVTARLDILEVVRATVDMLETLVEATEGIPDLKEAMVVEVGEEPARMDRPHLPDQLVVKSAVHRVPEELEEREELEEEEQLERNRAQDSLKLLERPSRTLPLRVSRASGRATARRDTKGKSDTSFPWSFPLERGGDKAIITTPKRKQRWSIPSRVRTTSRLRTPPRLLSRRRSTRACWTTGSMMEA